MSKTQSQLERSLRMENRQATTISGNAHARFEFVAQHYTLADLLQMMDRGEVSYIGIRRTKEGRKYIDWARSHETEKG